MDKDAVLIACMCDAYRSSKHSSSESYSLTGIMRDVLRAVRDVEASFKWSEDFHDAEEN
jgi:hypothetical protein